MRKAYFLLQYICFLLNSKLTTVESGLSEKHEIKEILTEAP